MADPQRILKSIRPGVYRGPNDNLPPEEWKIGYELEYMEGEKAFHLFPLNITAQLAQSLTGLVQLVRKEILASQQRDLQEHAEEKLGFPVDKVGVSEQVKIQLTQADDNPPSEGLSIGG